MKIDKLNNRHILADEGKVLRRISDGNCSVMKSISDTPTICQVKNYLNHSWNFRNIMKK